MDQTLNTKCPECLQDQRVKLRLQDDLSIEVKLDCGFKEATTPIELKFDI